MQLAAARGANPPGRQLTCHDRRCRARHQHHAREFGPALFLGVSSSPPRMAGFFAWLLGYTIRLSKRLPALRANPNRSKPVAAACILPPHNPSLDRHIPSRDRHIPSRDRPNPTLDPKRRH
jgi:hypothetical protein